jgi:D-psicose/D-tagatose/L-ribulose 3-epimerase
MTNVKSERAEVKAIDWSRRRAGLHIGGHRGDPESAPENTLAALEAAVAAGADYVEIDVHRSADGVFVVLHDDTVDRTTNGHGLVYETSSRDLFELDAGSWFDPAFASERLITLEQFLDWVQQHEGLGAMIETKPYGTGADVARAIMQSAARSQTCLVSFLPEELRAAKTVDPDLQCYLLFDDRPGKDIVELILEFGLDGADVEWSWMNEDFVDRMHEAGLAVIGSTADEPEAIARLVRLGADFVDTNRPRAAVAARDANAAAYRYGPAAKDQHAADPATTSVDAAHDETVRMVEPTSTPAIAACEWVFAGRPLADLAPMLAAHGYGAIELGGEPDRTDADGISDLLAGCGLKVSGLTASCDWPTDERDLANPDSEIRARAVRHFCRCVDLAVSVGAGQIGVLPGACGRFAPIADVARERAWAVEGLRAIGEYAGEHGVVVTVEPLNRYEAFLATRVEEALALISDVDLPNFGVVADAFHMMMEEADPAGAIELAGPYLRALHLADSNREGLGRGHLDMRPLVGAARRIGFAGPFTMEFTAPGADPYSADKGSGTAELLDAYARESSALVRHLFAA